MKIAAEICIYTNEQVTVEIDRDRRPDGSGAAAHRGRCRRVSDDPARGIARHARELRRRRTKRKSDFPLSRTADYLGGNFCFGAFDGDGSSAAPQTSTLSGGLKTKHRGHVVAVYVDPEARGTGVGEALFAALIATARHEVKQLHLVVTQQNEAAQRFYQRMGFVIYGDDPRGLRRRRSLLR